MARDFAKSFYESKAWKQCRHDYLELRHGLCERCGEPGNIVHHKIHITPGNISNPDITLNFDNLKCVCQDCHAAEHAKDSSTAIKKELTFTADGDIVKAPLFERPSPKKQKTERSH
jgi:5-methylcytosine-specific restriction endonuclease McrA